MACPVATRCIEELESLGCDFTLLLWMRQSHVIRNADFWPDLRVILNRAGFQAELLDDERRRQSFFQVIRSAFLDRGMSAFQPHNFVVAGGSGGKERSLELARLARWPRPHQPFCFQTRGDGMSLFFVYQSWRDGLAAMYEMLREGVYVLDRSSVSVLQIYEHCWGEQRFALIQIDWEAMESWFKGRRSGAQIREAALRFPHWFTSNMIRMGVLDPSTSLKFVVKDKTRAVEDGTLKVSFHMTVGLVGIPRHTHRIALSRLFEEPSRLLKQCHKDKSFDGLGDRDLDKPWIGVDWRTMTGGHGFSVMGSRKRKTDPLPSILHVANATESQATIQDTLLAIPNPDMVAVGLAKYKQMMYLTSYTVPWVDTATYTLRFWAEVMDNKVPRRGFEPLTPLRYISDEGPTRRGWAGGGLARGLVILCSAPLDPLGSCQDGSRQQWV